MILNNMKNKIKGKGIKIVLTEGHDLRVLTAAVNLLNDEMVLPVLVGDAAVINKMASDNNLDISKCELIDIETYSHFDDLVSQMVTLRKGKQTKEQCSELLKQSNYFGTMLVKTGLADGLVGGATYSTADTVRPALQLVKTKPTSNTVSSSFVLYKDDQKLIFGDCAIIVEPTSSDLCDIATDSAQTARVFGIDPVVAFLSFSTKGSGKGGNVSTVVEAVSKMAELNPDFVYDGEFQFDAAFDECVGKIKAPDSPVIGKTNVFVFPSLEAGNIGYKIAQRLGGFNAIGPILQGLNAPINDLSRGCSIQDVYELTIVTAAQHLEQ